jgi:hypothetical protein
MKSKALRLALAALIGTLAASMRSAHPILSFDETLDLAHDGLHCRFCRIPLTV